MVRRGHQTLSRMVFLCFLSQTCPFPLSFFLLFRTLISLAFMVCLCLQGLLAKSIRLRPLQRLYTIEESQEKVVEWLLSSPFLIERSSLCYLLNRLLSNSERDTTLPRVFEVCRHHKTTTFLDPFEADQKGKKLLTSRRTRLFRIVKTKSIVDSLSGSRSSVVSNPNVFALTSARMIYAKLSELLAQRSTRKIENISEKMDKTLSLSPSLIVSHPSPFSFGFFFSILITFFFSKQIEHLGFGDEWTGRRCKERQQDRGIHGRVDRGASAILAIEIRKRRGESSPHTGFLVFV